MKRLREVETGTTLATDLVSYYLQQHKFENYKCRCDQNILKVRGDINNKKKLLSNTDGVSDNAQQSH